METLIASFARAVRSLFAPGMMRTFIYSVVITFVILICFWIGASKGLIWLFDRPNSGFFLFDAASAIIVAITGLVAWFLFPGIMPVIVNFFDDKIASLIERQDYPHNLPAKAPPFWPEFWHDFRFSLSVVGLNILMLPLYLLLPVVNVILFYLLNGYLLGKEFFIMAARRHIPLVEAITLWKSKTRLITVAGMALAFMATLPVLNLFAPFWGIAVMTHIYHRLKQGAEILPPYK